MKIKLNNREEKINLIQEVVDYLGYWDEEKVLLLALEKICSIKASSEGRLLDLSQVTKHVKQSLVDAKERAYGAVLLYCYKNGIKTNLGYFYIVSSASFNGYYKLGYSQDVETRIQQYQIATPFKDFKIEKYLIVRNATVVEKLAINYLTGKMCLGEWFKSDDLNRDFKGICIYLDDIYGKANRFSHKSFNINNLIESSEYLNSKKND